MKLYRIYTEDVKDRREHLERVVGSWFEGYTILRGTGIWKGQREDTTIIEIMAEENLKTRVDVLGVAIARELRQECVMVVECEVESRFLQHEALAAA